MRKLLVFTFLDREGVWAILRVLIIIIGGVPKLKRRLKVLAISEVEVGRGWLSGLRILMWR